jgi:hypothetical protein
MISANRVGPCFQARAELEQAAGTVCGHHGSSTFKDIVFFLPPETGGDLRIPGGKDTAEATAGRRLFLLGEVESEGVQEHRRCISGPEFVEIVARIMIIDVRSGGGFGLWQVPS